MSDYNMIKAELGGLEISPAGVAVKQFSQYFALAELMQRGGYLPKNVNVEGAVIAMMHGATVGLTPFPAVQGIAVINGRPTVWGDTQVGICKASGQLEDEKTEVLNGPGDEKQGYRYTVKRKGINTPFSAVFTVAMAKKAGLWTKAGPWQTNPYRMLFVRARSFALRDAFADILQGFQCREEVEDEIQPPRDITAEVTVAESPAAEAAAAAPAETPAPRKNAKLRAAAKAAAVEMAKPAPAIAAPAVDAGAIEEVATFNGDFPPPREAVKAEGVVRPQECAQAAAKPAPAPDRPRASLESKLGTSGLSFAAEKR